MGMGGRFKAGAKKIRLEGVIEAVINFPIVVFYNLNVLVLDLI